MQIVTIWKGFEAFERDLKDSKRIRSFINQIRTIRNEIEAFECTLEPFERDSKDSSINWNCSKGIWSIGMQIRTIRKRFEEFETKFEPFEKGIRSLRKPNSNHSKGIKMCYFNTY